MGKDASQGTLDLLILETLARGSMHGYGITCSILTASDNQLRVEEGSLYPALRRLESAGLIKAEWKPSDNNRRTRYYRLTRAGERLPLRRPASCPKCVGFSVTSRTS